MVPPKELSIEQMYAADLAIVKDRRFRVFKIGENRGEPVVRTVEMVVVGQLRKHYPERVLQTTGQHS